MSDSLRWRGLWDFEVKYEKNDVVYFTETEKTYVCVNPCINIPPNALTYYFEVLAGVDISSIIDGGVF